MKRYTDRYQVRTAGGRLLASFHHVEEAERACCEGNSRELWIWFEGKYFHKRTYIRNGGIT